MKNKFIVLAVSVGALIGALPSSAHHSFAAEYDTAKPVTLTGKFAKLDWINPHSAVYFDVTDEATGKTTQWRAETPPPNAMLRAGLRPNMLHAGDIITLNGNLAKDGSNVMWCGSVKFPNGAVVGLTATLPADQRPDSK
jgi:hypothetical protein